MSSRSAPGLAASLYWRLAIQNDRDDCDAYHYLRKQAENFVTLGHQSGSKAIFRALGIEETVLSIEQPSLVQTIGRTNEVPSSLENTSFASIEFWKCGGVGKRSREDRECAIVV
jgi:hypothetical protein